MIFILFFLLNDVFVPAYGSDSPVFVDNSIEFNSNSISNNLAIGKNFKTAKLPSNDEIWVESTYGLFDLRVF